MKHTITIRLGAAHWDATIATADGPLHFNIRAMTREQKGKFFAALRDMAQQAYGGRRR